MATKLTLSIEEQVIESAKEYAKKQGRSLSSIVEEYLNQLVIINNEQIIRNYIH